ncbi:MAG: DUF349 domain-containing protein [Lentisphaeria bacterium]|nr:DUF349 domain-containing protein [Lentisphaeria bacterium]
MSNEMQSLSSGSLSEPLKELLHRYESVCKKLEELPDTPIQDVDVKIAQIDAEFNALPELPEEFAEVINKRYADASKKVQLFRKEIEERSCELQKIISAADSVIAAGELATAKEVESIEKKLSQFDGAAENSDVQERLNKLAPLLEKIKSEQAAELERIKKCDELTAKLEALDALEDFAAIKAAKEEIKKEYDSIGSVPSANAKRYSDALNKIRTKLNQHYETLDLARWESYTRKLDLLKKIEELAAIPDQELNTAAAKLQELRLKWKECGVVPNEKKDEVNNRFLELTRPLQKRIDDYYTQLRQAKKVAVEQKMLMCATAEALADSTSWKSTSEQFKAMQADWKQLPHTGSTEKELFTRFRAAADKFFTARDAFFKERNSKIDAAKEAKLALIAKVAELDPADRNGAKKLREEFKATANAGKFELDLRKQFDSAMDAFFSALRESISRKENRSSELVKELETLAADPLPGRTRAEDIKTELAQLKVRNNARKEHEAISKFERAEKEAMSKADNDKFAEFKRIVLALGNNPAEKPEGIVNFSRLVTVFELLNSTEANAAAKLDKIIQASRKTTEKILSELRELAGNDNEQPLTLAQELEAAILGNFARTEVERSRKARISDIRHLRQEFMTIYLNADEFSDAVSEVEELLAKISANQQ